VVVVFLDSDLVSEQFADETFIRGLLVLFRWSRVFVGVISFRGYLCYSGPCSSSLALVCVFWVVKVFRVFGGSRSLCVEPFPCDMFVVCTTAYHVVLSSFLCAGFPMDRSLLLRDWESVSSCNLVWRDLVFL
jgi:hypothetical protein